MDRKKIGLYFGSFNPVHNGHMVTARTAVEKKNLDSVWFVVSPKNPLKDSSILCDENHRLEMVRLAIKSMYGKYSDKYEATDVEFMLPKPSYTVDTIDKLKRENPEIEFSVIIGSDILPCLNKWKNCEDLLTFNKIIVIDRPGHSHAVKFSADFTPVFKSFEAYRNLEFISSSSSFELSSTTIRERIKSGLSVDFLIPEKVAEYIKKNRLFIGDENSIDGKVQKEK
jgi:nicotinate-nucleotide adenylyltransferase